MPVTATTIGQRIKYYRHRRDLSVRQLAARAGVHPTLIHKWERGDGLPNATNIIALCRALHVTPNVLLLGYA